MRVFKKESIKLLVILFLSCVALFLFYITYELSPKNYLQVSFLNVGQGDSILFVTPHGGRVLVDGGPDQKVLSELGETLPIFSKSLGMVIATHDDADHIAGLIGVLKKYDVKVLLYSLPKSESVISKELMKIVQEKSVQLVQVDRPMIIKSEDGLLIKILFPVTNMDGTTESNDASIVTQFVFGKDKFLLTGDLPQTGEMFLVNKYGETLKSNILKLGHHGSDTSTNPEFLQTVRPDVAVVSAGKNNSFGHPHKSVLDLLEKFGIKVLRTDELGRIDFYSDGESIWR
jgi:competence protein ComEC